METLIVDDDDMTVYLHKVFVKESKFSQNPIAFASAKSTLEYLLADYSADKHYCVLLDLNMPIMDGWQFLDAISKEKASSNIYVVIVTSSVNDRDRKKCKEYAHVIDYMEKPLNQTKLKQLKENIKLSQFF